MERSPSKARRVVFVALLLGLVGGGYLLLSGDGQTDEERIASVLDLTEQAFEEHDIDGVVDHMTDDYSDSWHKDRNALKNFLRGMILQNRRFSVAVRDRRITVDGETARATFVASGSERQGDDLIATGGRTYDVTVELRKEGSDWRIRRIDFERSKR